MPSSTTTPDSPYAEIHDDEKGSTCAGLLLRAAEFLAANGIPRIERVLSDNAYTYRKSIAFKEAVAQIGAEQRFIKPHCPRTNGKVERINRTLATEWAFRQIFTSNQALHDALALWLKYYNTERIHTGIGGTPISRVLPRPDSVHLADCYQMTPPAFAAIASTRSGSSRWTTGRSASRR